MAHQIDGAEAETLDEGDHVGDVLGDSVVGALAVPVLGEEMAQADADDAMLLRQRSDHATPDAEIIQ